jgi:DNA-binding MarR family transcriptional regulator
MKMVQVIVDSDVVKTEELLHTVAFLMKRRTRELVGKFDITPQQFEVMQVLKENGKLSIGALCRALNFACSTGTDMLDRMERLGFVERVRSAEDRRMIYIEILPKGEGVLNEITASHREQITSLLSKMNPQQSEAIIASLQQLKSILTA